MASIRTAASDRRPLTPLAELDVSIDQEPSRSRDSQLPPARSQERAAGEQLAPFPSSRPSYDNTSFAAKRSIVDACAHTSEEDRLVSIHSEMAGSDGGIARRTIERSPNELWSDTLIIGGKIGMGNPGRREDPCLCVLVARRRTRMYAESISVCATWSAYEASGKRVSTLIVRRETGGLFGIVESHGGDFRYIYGRSAPRR